MEEFAMILADGDYSSSGGILLILLVLAIAWVLTARSAVSRLHVHLHRAGLPAVAWPTVDVLSPRSSPHGRSGCR